MALKSSNKVDTNVYEIEVTVAPEEFTQACKDAYLKRRKSIQLPGFRKGKAAQGMIEKLYGEGFFYEDALEIVYPAVVTAAIEEAGLRTVDSPAELDVKTISKSEGVDMTMKVTVYPEVKLGQYKGLEAVQLPTEADDEDVANELTNMLDRNSRRVTVEDRAAEMGDTAEIDFEGFVDGVAFDGGKGENYPLELGSGSFIPGFEEQVAGHKTEEAFDVNVTFPEEYQAENLAGKDAVFKVKIHEIKTKEVPALDDEFAKDVSEFETLEEFKKSLGDKLLDSKTKSAQQEYENAVIEQLVGNMEADIPDAMVEVQLDKLMEDFSMRLSNQGMKMEDYLAMMGATPESMRASARPTAQRQVEVDLALTAVADAESITISDEELEEELKKIAGEYKLELDEVKRAIPVEDMKRDLRLRKASELVMAEAKVGEAPKKEEAEEKPKKTTRKKKAESAEGEEAAAEAKPKKTTRKKKAEEAEEPKAE